MLLLDDGGSGCQALSADPSAFPPPLRAAARDLWLLSSDSANASRVQGRLTRSLYTGGAGSKRTASGNRPLFGELVQKTSPPEGLALASRVGFTPAPLQPLQQALEHQRWGSQEPLLSTAQLSLTRVQHIPASQSHQPCCPLDPPPAP